MDEYAFLRHKRDEVEFVNFFVDLVDLEIELLGC